MTPAGPVASALMWIQQKEGVPASGVADERTVRAATRLGFSIYSLSQGRCSYRLCPNERVGPLWLVVFGLGTFGAFIGCCPEHPPEPGLGALVLPFREPDSNEAFRVMSDLRAVHDVMAS